MDNCLQLIIKSDPEDPNATEIFIDGFVDERQYRFLLDTGAAMSEIILDEFTSSFPSVGNNIYSGAFASSDRDIIMVHSFLVGPLSRKNFQISRKSKNELSRHSLIGMDLLKHYSCEFRFDEGIMLINSPEAEYSKKIFRNLFLGKKFHPYIPIQFGEVQANTVWDTGAGITVTDQSFIDQNPELFTPIGSSTGTDSTGASQETPMYLMAASTIGQCIFPPHKVAGVDLSHVNSTTEVPMDMILGYSTIGMANWIFDFPSKQWAILNIHPV